MPATCSRCGGSRAEPGSGATTCPSCQGTGTENLNTGPFLLRSICRRCQGSGSVVRYPCVECEGKGKVIARQRVNVAIPAVYAPCSLQVFHIPGVEDGQVLRVSVGGSRTGTQELFVQVRVERSREFRREGPDIHSDVSISLAQAALGGKIRVPGIYETMLVTIPPGSASHDRIRLPGKGISRVNGYGYGDHYLHIKVRAPRRLTELQRALLLAYAETEQDVTGTIEGVTSTESGLDKLRKALLGTSTPSSSGRETFTNKSDTTHRGADPQADEDEDGGERRAIDTTSGFLLSRIRAALLTNPDLGTVASDAQQPVSKTSENVEKKKSRASDK
ncbi:hypothetical protein PHET_08000 [Paragonimus heterotremus]|uniref:CR-type domain-containing protein n=1 Tax=Paragonimus heterotremus TaxID=100268 RepID=A0A8J4T4Q6_9TREM|nr:hypothetical protein PHET_08000 [Paragonimus heterotremus]